MPQLSMAVFAALLVLLDTCSPPGPSDPPSADDPDGGIVASTTDAGSTPAPEPPIEPGTHAIDVRARRNSACVLLSSGQLACWGLSNLGDAYHRGDEHQARPTRIEGLSDVTSFDFGYGYACAVHADGRVSCWGTDVDGSLRLGSSPTSTCRHFDEPCIPAPGAYVTGLEDIATVALGSSAACARSRSGVVSCWGRNQLGTLGDRSLIGRADARPILEGAQSLAAGESYFCATTASNVFCWGNNEAGQLGTGLEGSETCDGMLCRTAPSVVEGMRGAATLSLGEGHACALDEGRLSCWGAAVHGAFGDLPTEICGYFGLPCVSRPVTLTSSAVLTAQSLGSICHVESTGGSLRCSDRTIVPLPTSFASITIGAGFGCGRTLDERVYCWGENLYGQVGDGSEAPREHPVLVDLR